MMSRQPFQQSLRPGKEPGGNGGGEPVRRPARIKLRADEAARSWPGRGLTPAASG